MTTFGQLYRIGNTYESAELPYTEKQRWIKCEVIDVQTISSGKIKATIKNSDGEVFITKARKPSVKVFELENSPVIDPYSTRSYNNHDGGVNRNLNII